MILASKAILVASGYMKKHQGKELPGSDPAQKTYDDAMRFLFANAPTYRPTSTTKWDMRETLLHMLVPYGAFTTWLARREGVTTNAVNRRLIRARRDDNLAKYGYPGHKLAHFRVSDNKVGNYYLIVPLEEDDT